MELTKSLLKQFNTPQTTLVISGYPEKKSNGDTTHGIAWYTQKTLRAQAQKYGLKFVVLVEKGKDNEPQIDAKGKILILRIFDKKRSSLFPQIFRWLQLFSQTKKVIVHSEFCADGGARNFLLLLPFLALIKSFGKEVTFFAHNVVDDFTSIAPHLDLKKDSLKLKIFNLGIKAYNVGLGLIVDQIVVLDKALEKRITRYVLGSKVVFTPIWVESAPKTTGKNLARKKLGFKQNEKIILYFGFVSWYKGADWLIKNFNKYFKTSADENVRLVIAGGEAYSLKQKPYYQRYYSNLKQITQGQSKITLTGFVPEKDIPLYFEASDLVVFPYRGLIGASGGLNHALTYQKPFLLSQKMAAAINDSFNIVLKSEDLEIDDIVFGHTEKGIEKIVKTSLNKSKLEKLDEVSKKLAEKFRMLNCIQNEYNKIYACSSFSLHKNITAFLQSRGIYSPETCK